ncbi:EamA family transporter [Pelagibacterales bacterium SAG-MED34]|nr:EamA family transporter [Pelagibacterales bacterium SAG-MED34]
MNWIVVTVIAAFFQNLRSSFQKKINKDVSTIASTYVRFSFALPLALVLFFIYFREVSVINEILNQPGFLINVTLASIFQVIFTFVLLYLFKFSNFVVGTSLSKTEVVQVAIFEYLILNEKLSKLGISGILISTLGVIILSIKDLKYFLYNIFSKTTLIGLVSGLFLALSIVYFRSAALSLENFDSNFEKVISTLLFGLLIPTIILTLYLLVFEKKEFRKLYNDRYDCMLIGIGGFFASLSWFYAFTLIQASFVRAVGQIELLFSYFSSKYLFKEKIKLTEILGIFVFVIGVSILLLSRVQN